MQKVMMDDIFQQKGRISLKVKCKNGGPLMFQKSFFQNDILSLSDNFYFKDVQQKPKFL